MEYEEFRGVGNEGLLGGEVYKEAAAVCCSPVLYSKLGASDGPMPAEDSESVRGTLYLLVLNLQWLCLVLPLLPSVCACVRKLSQRLVCMSAHGVWSVGT